MPGNERLLWLQLAREKGMTVAQLQATMTSREFSEEIAFRQIDPELPVRIDYAAAAVCRMIFAMMGSGKSKVPPLEDFLVSWKPEEPPSPATVEKKLEAWAAGMGNRFVDKKKKDVKK